MLREVSMANMMSTPWLHTLVSRRPVCGRSKPMINSARVNTRMAWTPRRTRKVLEGRRRCKVARVE